MTWYGSKLDTKVKVPRLTPPYHTEDQIVSLIEATKNKRTHKGCIVRDTLLTSVALKTGMRRSELASLEPKDIHPRLFGSEEWQKQ